MVNAINYVVTYCICELSVSSGVMGSFPTLFAAQKYKERAALALKNAGLCGSVDVVAVFPEVLIEDPDKFFMEY